MTCRSPLSLSWDIPYDYQLGHLNSYTSGTHEVSLRYEFEYSVSATSPRYF
ncbi:MAG: type IX secretion system membrane protein PorP/SprF [Marinilabiliales bacterium]|nr:type IX secretion system membrane protein PorP/SprF [Marinilabiliales bacterium]